MEALPLFKEGDFEGYELHLGLLKGNEADCIKRLPPYINIAFIHNPTKIKIGSNVERFDLTSDGIIRAASWEALKKTVALAKIVEAGVVVHGTLYDPRQDNKRKKIEKLVKEIGEWGEDFYFENGAIWNEFYYERRTLLCNIKDFKFLRESYGKNLKTTFDLEHAVLTCCFQEFLKYNVNCKKTRLPWQEFNIAYKDFIKNNQKELQGAIAEYVEQFIATTGHNIRHLHINGSDFTSFIYDATGELPLQGEHLDIKGDRESSSDKNDYQKWLYLLRKYTSASLGAVLELRPSGRFREKLLNSKKKLTQEIIDNGGS